ncbi:MAG: DUF1499 domain-containing protein [Planctomycetia bacterium]
MSEAIEPTNMVGTAPTKRRRVSKWVSAPLTGVAVVCVYFAFLGWWSQTPVELGVVEGRLRPCPSKPNCVCSFDSSASAAAEPIPFAGTAAEAIECLKAAVASFPRTRVIEEGPNYLRVEFRSFVFRFVDDVEFLYDAESRKIHYRAAARVGTSDFGVNSARMEKIRDAFTTIR